MATTNSMDKSISSMVGVINTNSDMIFAADDDDFNPVPVNCPSSTSEKNFISVKSDASKRRSSNASHKSTVYRHQRFDSIPKVAISVPSPTRSENIPVLSSSFPDEDLTPPSYLIPRSSSPQISISSEASNKRSSFYAHQNSSNPLLLGGNVFVLAPPNAPFANGEFTVSPPSRSSSPGVLSTGSLPGENGDRPFNFQSTVVGGSPPAKPNNASQRRGHRYKHSSVSLNFFQEPPQRAPLPIPESLPIPNFAECFHSMSREQRIRALWCGFHFIVCFLVYNCDMPFTALQALAHLLLYDAVGAALCVAVDVLSNFDVWKQSSLHHPFGLERIEVLAGYALAVFLLFMGGDMMSHSLQDMIQSLYAAPGEHIHSHGKEIHNHANPDAGDYHDSLGWFSMVFRIVLGIIVTLVSAIGLDNHSRINNTLRRAVEAGPVGLVGPFVQGKSRFHLLVAIMSNPCHFMTLTFSFALLLFPLMGVSGYQFVDTLLTPLISASMCYMGWSLAKILGGMLVMSYPGEDHIGDIERIICKDSTLVESVSRISLWQVHHGLWLASMKIVMSGTDDDEQALRQRASLVVKQVMGEATDDEYTWQTSVDITRTTLGD